MHLSRSLPIVLGSVAFVGALEACVLSAEGFTTKGGDADAAPPADAAPSSTTPIDLLDAGSAAKEDAGDAGTTSGSANLVVNADMELGCAGYDVAFGFMSEDGANAHGGSKSCKFCLDTNFEGYFSAFVDADVDPTKTYYGELWLKPAAAPETLAGLGYVGSSLRVTTANPTTDNDQTAGPPLTNDWQRVTTLFKPSYPAKRLELEFRLQQSGNPAAKGNVICVYLDDAVMKTMP